jgi:N-acetylneuraminate synthase
MRPGESTARNRLGRVLGDGGVFVVGEVAQAHDGSLGLAHAFIDAIADAGAHAVKFQTHIAAAESTPSEPWNVPFSRQDASRYDYWKRMEFTEEGWVGLAQHARERGLAFLSSPFSLEAVELLERVGVAAWKVASGEVSNTPLLRRIAAAGGPVLLSSGMSPWAELDAAVELLHGSEVAVLQCTSAYPVAPDDVGLNVLAELRERYGCAVGLSDHSGTIYPSLAAVALGATVLEVHVTMSRAMFGPDVPASVTPDELRRLTDGARLIHEALRSPVDKDAMAERLAPMRERFMRSVVASRDLAPGATLGPADLAVKKPAGGLPPEALESLLGRRLRAPLARDERVTEAALEPEVPA